jgi:pimeloyl-ACP methyl ester carboxylesterase
VRGLARLIPGARLAEIAGAGHLPMADAPEAVAAAVNPFLAALPA